MREVRIFVNRPCVELILIRHFEIAYHLHFFSLLRLSVEHFVARWVICEIIHLVLRLPHHLTILSTSEMPNMRRLALVVAQLLGYFDVQYLIWIFFLPH